jgi:hypothetical protein
LAIIIISAVKTAREDFPLNIHLERSLPSRAFRIDIT